jgi:hypothetical protein
MELVGVKRRQPSAGESAQNGEERERERQTTWRMIHFGEMRRGG